MMAVIFSNEVKIRLKDYIDVLKGYPISTKRAHEKYDAMLKALMNLGNTSSMPPICMSKDLGQSFDENGNPRYQNLRRFNYKDKGGFQWAFACLYNTKYNRITITKMMASINVKEDIFREIASPILEFMSRLDKIK